MTSGVRLPEFTGTASQWQFVDWRDVKGTAKGAGGKAVIELQQLDGDEMWLLDHSVVTCTSPTRSVVRLYAGSEAPANLLDGSSQGPFDVADWPNGLRVRPSTALVAVWSPVVDGSVATLTAQVRVFRRR